MLLRLQNKEMLIYMNIHNRRYTGSKYKLMDWIKGLLIRDCPGCKSFFDVFGGTGVVTASVLDMYENITINDFLFSNEVIYKAFFGKDSYDENKLNEIADLYNKKDKAKLAENYVSQNFGGKYFSNNDAKLIGWIREDLNKKLFKKEITQREFDILLASLLYSFDKIANTCGHYDAYIKGKTIADVFVFNLISPIDIKNKKISIYRKDANELVKTVKADIAFIDPPYNSRQYSRFYHVLENITQWKKPKLTGTAMKPPAENMSEYCRNSAAAQFADLVDNLDVKYIAVTYNNTYNSKSSSSKNKITLEEIKSILEAKGKTQIYEKSHQCFNAGKTEFDDHKEILFITKVGEFDD